jgi:DNA mismatch repair protein MutL
VKFRDPERMFHAVFAAARSLHEPASSPTKVEFDEARRNVRTPLISQALPSYESLSPQAFREGAKIAPMVRERVHPEWRGASEMSFRPLGQVQGTYVLCEAEEGLIFIDQHAAHERILFEKLKREYEARSLPCARFLIPIVIELSVEESHILESSLEEFHSIGFEIDPAGEKTFAIRSIPSLIEKEDPKAMIRKILDEVVFWKGDKRGGETAHPILVTLACHSAIKANFTLRREEMEELVKDLHSFSFSTTCPHGRPVFFRLRWDELDRQFKRDRRS